MDEEKIVSSTLALELPEDEWKNSLDEFIFKSTLGKDWILASRDLSYASDYYLHRLYSVDKNYRAELEDTFILPNYVGVDLCYDSTSERVIICITELGEVVHGRYRRVGDNHSLHLPFDKTKTVTEMIRDHPIIFPLLPKPGLEEDDGINELILSRIQQLALNESPTDPENFKTLVKLSPDGKWAIARLMADDMDTSENDWGKLFDSVYLYCCDREVIFNFMPQLEADHHVGVECTLKWVKGCPATLRCTRPLATIVNKRRAPEECWIAEWTIGADDEMCSLLEEIIPKDLLNIICEYLGGLESLEPRDVDN